VALDHIVNTGALNAPIPWFRLIDDLGSVELHQQDNPSTEKLAAGPTMGRPDARFSTFCGPS
jgi:hypothetical protein